jgi:type IV fimbrial biogenesis protein FimT
MPVRIAAGARGFTLTEVMITVAVIGILSAVGIPSLRDFMNENRSRSTMNQLTADLNFARLEAIKRNAHVLVCPRVAGTSTCDTSANWANGWMVCYDADNNAACDTTSATDPNPLKVANAVDSQLTLASPAVIVNFAPVGSSAAQVVFTLTTGTTVRTGTVAATGNVSSKKN